MVPYVKEYLDSLKSKWGANPNIKSERLDHLISLVESWQQLNPESRSRATDFGLEDDEIGKYLAAHYPYKLDDVKAVLVEYVLVELERELYGGEPKRSLTNPVLEEFKKRWRNNLDEKLLDRMDIAASIDQQDPNKVVLTPNVLVPVRLTSEDKAGLYEKFGELNVKGFLRHFKDINRDGGGTAGEGETSYSPTGLPEDAIFSFNREFRLPPCTVYITDRNSFDVEFTPPSDLLERAKLDAIRLRVIIETLGKNVDIDASKYFSKEYERARSLANTHVDELTKHAILAESDTLTNFLKLATKLAKTTDDFSVIREINSYRNRIANYVKIRNFVQDLVEPSVRRRSVVSFYVSKDVWRFLPLVIKGKDWISIANTYLASKQK